MTERAYTSNRKFHLFGRLSGAALTCMGTQFPAGTGRVCAQTRRVRLRTLPSFDNSPLDCYQNSPYAERTAYGDFAICGSATTVPDGNWTVSTGNCVVCKANRALPWTRKPLKRLDLNFLSLSTPHCARHYTDALRVGRTDCKCVRMVEQGQSSRSKGDQREQGSESISPPSVPGSGRSE